MQCGTFSWLTKKKPNSLLGTFFFKYGQVEDLSSVISKPGIATWYFVFQVTLTSKIFGEIPNVFMRREKRKRVVVEGRRPYCWPCGASEHMAKACIGRSVTELSQTTSQLQTTPSQAGTTAAIVAATEKTPEKGRDREWEEVRNGRKTTRHFSS